MQTQISIDDCFRVLELDRGASREAIEQSYLRLRKVWHPDRFKDDSELRALAEERTKSLNIAFETLTKGSPQSSDNVPPPIHSVLVETVEYCGSLVTQFIVEGKRGCLASDDFVRSTIGFAKHLQIEVTVGGEISSDRRIGMQFDVDERTILFPSRQHIDREFPVFALATIHIRDCMDEGKQRSVIKKGLEIAGWDGSAYPEPNYIRAEHRICKLMAELDIARIIARDNSLLADMRARFFTRDLNDVARNLLNSMYYSAPRR